MLASTEQDKRDSQKRQSVFAPVSVMSELDEVARELHYNTRTKTLEFLITQFNDSQHSKDALPIATFETIMKTEAPVVLSGIPGSGKSYTLDIFLKECRKRSIPFSVFNSDNRDHSWITNERSWSDIMSLHWLELPNSAYIVRLDHDLAMRKTTMHQISQTILRLEDDPRLEPWILAFEEAHDYYKIEAFNSILRRMRKSTRKLIVVSTEAELFKMCRPLRPIPFS